MNQKNVEEKHFEEFKANFNGSYLTSLDEEYNEVRKIWNGMHDKKPALIARCLGVADVIAAVNFTRETIFLFQSGVAVTTFQEVPVMTEGL